MNEQQPTHLDLFSGIGGFSIAFESAGFRTVGFSEVNPHACKILRQRWPNVPNLGNIRNFVGSPDWGVDVITGGFPCQPFSHAGKRKGKDDNRYLWPEMFRIIREVQPTFVLAENVYGLVTNKRGMVLDQVCSDLEASDFEVLPPLIVPAAAVNALHRRDRVWICAHSKHGRRGAEQEQQQGQRPEVSAGCSGAFSYPKSKQSGRLQPLGFSPNTGAASEIATGHAPSQGFPNWAGGEVEQPAPLTELERPDGREIERDFCGMAHGVSNRVDRLKCLGNAIVPQVARVFARAIYQQLRP